MKKSIKQQLVEYMIENGNDFRYTDMIKKVLKINKGEDYEYNHNSPDRGYWSCNFSKHAGSGHMLRGGNCCVYKNDRGRWSAKFFTQEEIKEYKVKNVVDALTNQLKHVNSTFNINWNNADTREQKNVVNEAYRERVNYFKTEAIKKLVKIK